jgi:hypothetical protein
VATPYALAYGSPNAGIHGWLARVTRAGRAGGGGKRRKQ